MNILESFDTITRYSGKMEQYYDIYQQWFQKFQNRHPNVLEIGIMCGGSMEAWRNFFGPGSVITGVDLSPRIRDLGLPDTEILIGNQGDSNFWDHFVNKTLPLDVIIDDGSHFQNHQILTFEKLFLHLNEGGIYLVEDTHASFLDHFGGKLGDPNTFIEYCKRIVDQLHIDYYHTDSYDDLYRHVKSIHFYDSVVVIEKGLRPKYQPTYHNRNLS